MSKKLKGCFAPTTTATAAMTDLYIFPPPSHPPASQSIREERNVLVPLFGLCTERYLSENIEDFGLKSLLPE
jgi:hypothetical protein